MRVPVNVSLCDKHRQLKSSLTAEDLSALVLACTGKGSEDTAVLGKARRVLKNARDCSLWFVCDCQPSPQALLHPRLLNGGFSLVRNANSKHAADCVFVPSDKAAPPSVAVDEADETQSAPDPDAYRVRTVFEGKWLTGKPLESVVVARTESLADQGGASSGAGPRLDGLSKRLFAACNTMGLCSISSDDMVLKQGKWLVDGKDKSALAKLVGMPMGYDLSWQDVGCTDLRDLAGLRKRLAVLKPRFGDRALEGFMLAPLTEVRLQEKGDGVLVNTSRDYEFKGTVHGRIALPGFGRGGEGSYLCLGRLRETKGLNYIPIIGASVLQVFSPHLWMPVESALERKTLTVLLSVLRWYRQRTEGQSPAALRIDKPLFDMGVENPDSACRPDFILTFPDGMKVVIETMGMRDDREYMERKDRMHPRMLALPQVCGLLEDGPEEDDALKATLCRMIAERS